MSAPLVLVLDDVHLLHNLECQSAVSVLVDHMPPGSRFVLAGRDQPPVRVARLRAEGRLVELGPSDLALTVDEAAGLLRDADVALVPEEVAALHQHTEGWAVGLYLAALAIRAGVPAATAASVGGSDVFAADYFESEFLGRISEEQREFLTRTAVLERMTGSLCESVLERPGAGAELAELARSNMLLVPLDHQGEWYRYHNLFRDMLRAELQRREPATVAALHHRAAAWCMENNLPEDALEYSIGAADVDRVAQLFEELWLPVLMNGRDVTGQQWIKWMDDHGGVDEHPMVAIASALSAAGMGRATDADRWTAWVERWQADGRAQHSDAITNAWAKVLQAELCRHGPEQMGADADYAAEVFLAAQHPLIPLTSLLQGIARLLAGDLESGDTFLKDSVATGATFPGPHYPIAVAERALLAIANDRWDEAELLAETGRTLLLELGMQESTLAAPMVGAVQSRVAMHRGDHEAARQYALRAQRLRPWLSYAIPFIAAQARISLTRVYLRLGDVAAARMLVREIDDILQQRPLLGNLVDEANDLRQQCSAAVATSARQP